MRRKPKRTTYRKRFKGPTVGRGQARPRLNQGERGLRAREYGRVTARQLEAMRRVIRHHRNRVGQVWRRVFPDQPVTKKPREVRMGGGKGSVEYWAVQVRPGRRICEVEARDEAGRRKAVRALRAAAKKRPIRTNRRQGERR